MSQALDFWWWDSVDGQGGVLMGSRGMLEAASHTGVLSSLHDL